MGVAVKLPTISDALETWCSFCASRSLPPETAYCAECRPAYQHFRKELSRSLGQRLARAIREAAPDPVGDFSPTARRTHLR
jgi:hypothetical protein